MIRRPFDRFAAGAATVALAAVLVALPAASASAAVPTSVEFESPGPVSVTFGEQWTIEVSVSTTYDEGPTLRLGPNDGTVDVYLTGIAGAFATALPIQPDGVVYVSQPTDQPLLPAAVYDVSAIYNPAPGGYYSSSQTTTPLTLTVTALEVSPTVTIENDTSVSEQPIISASLSGSYVDTVGGAPAGTWDFTLRRVDGSEVFAAQVAQPQNGTEAVRVIVDSALTAGTSYTLMSTFTPAMELAGGVTVGDISDSAFEIPSGTLAETIATSVPVPLWLAIIILVLVLGLAGAGIALGVILGRRAPRSTTTEAQPRRIPGDPANVEYASLNELGLPEPETIPELLPEGAGPKNPTSTTWLLSDVEPATGFADASEAPTERLDAITAADLPTERIDADDADDSDDSENTDTADDAGADADQRGKDRPADS